MKMRSGLSRWLVALVVAGTTGLGCGSDEPVSPNHSVYFVGNVYDGATGERLAKAALSAISIEYRDKVIKVSIDAEGRFVSVDPLPTWQDYMVTIEAAGYRPFVSRNAGFEVPASLAAMNTGLGEISTTQTFTFDAYLFPTTVKAPPASLSVNLVDDTGLPTKGQAAGMARFRPTAVSAVQVGAKDTAVGAPRASRRVWTNDEDLLAKTLTKSFKDGQVPLAEGELSYGVSYEVAIYDVDGYVPFVSDGTAASPHYAAGAVALRYIQLVRSAREPLKLLRSSATMCTPPLVTSTAPGAQITLTFSEDIELVGTTYAEDVDDNVKVVSTGTCDLKADADATKQERGTKVEITGATLTFSWNPSGAFADSVGGTACTPPMSIVSVTYTNLGKLFVQPKSDESRKASLSSMLAMLNPAAVSTALTCPTP